MASADRRKAWIACYSLLALLCACSPIVAEGSADDELVLAPDNTVILDASTYAGRSLQHYLIKFFAGAEEAAPYKLDQKSDRSASAHFPLFKGRNAQLPAGKNVIAVGKTDYLLEEDRERLGAERVGGFLIKRRGNVIVVAGWPMTNPWHSNYKAMSLFLDKVCGIRFYAPGDLWTSRPRPRRESGAKSCMELPGRELDDP